MNKEKCKEKVYPNDRWGAFHPHQCSFKIWKDGYCKIHHPDTVKKRQKEADKRYRHKIENSPLVKMRKKIADLESEIEKLKCENEHLSKIIQG